MFSIIETGGKQYKVKENDKIKVEKLDGEAGATVVFDKVLLQVSSDDNVEVGAPYIKDAKVIGEIVRQGRGKKLIVFKYKPKKRERTKKGHRQPFTEVAITSI